MNPTLSFVCARPGPAVANARINATTSHVFIQRIVALPSTPRTQDLALHAETTLTPLLSPLPTDVRQTQRRGRALRPPATPCRQRQYYYRKRKRHHLQRFRGHPGLQAEREVEERAEEERAGDRPQRIPGGKNGDGDGDPPQAVGHPLGPGRPVGHREEAAAHPRQRAAEDDGQATYQRDVH